MARWHCACRLSEKALKQGHHVVIALEDETEATAISEHLWCFRPESFLPHQLQSEQGDAPILCVWDEDRDHYHQLLINLRHDIPEWFSRFQRVAEIVVQEPRCLASTRAHYQFYRNRGYPLKSHQITQ